MRRASLRKSFEFAAAHALTGVPEKHPCRVLHGHTWTVFVEVAGMIDPDTGMVLDYRKVSEVVKPLIDRLDHSNLNDFFSNPTSENVAHWLYAEIAKCLPKLYAVEVSESPKTLCRVTKDDL